MKKIVGIAALLAALVTIICVYQLLTTGAVTFFSLINIMNLTRRIGILGIYAIGAGIVILSGGIDLSIGSVIAITASMIALSQSNWGWEPGLMALLMIPVCAVLGLWHSFLIGRFKLQPFIVTLSSLLFIRGLSRGLLGGRSLTVDNFRHWGNDSFLGLPIPFCVLIVIALLVGFLMNFTIYGRYLYAIGRNEEAVRYSGIKVGRVRTLAFVLCAVLACIAGILETSYTGDVQPASTGLMYEMWAIAAAVLGGCSLRGGEGSVIGVIIGAALIRVMENGLNLMGIPDDWKWAVVGIVIIGGVIADAVYRLRSAKKVKA